MGNGSSSPWYFKQTYDVTDEEAYERANEYENVVENLHNFTDEANTIICDLDDGDLV